MFSWQYQPIRPNQKFDSDFIETLRQAYVDKSVAAKTSTTA